MKCPLCGEEKFVRRKRFETKKIISDYSKQLGVDAKGYFHEEYIDLCQCVNCGMGFFPEGIEGDSLFYEHLSKFPWYYMEEKYEYDLALDVIRKIKPNSILEIGSGEGFFLDKIKDSFNVHATEHNVEAINVLKSKGIPLDEENMTYDFIITFQVLEHVKNLGEFIKWLMSKLDKGGYLFIAVPNPESEYIKEVPQILDLPPHHMNHIYEETFNKMEEIFSLHLEKYETELISTVHFPGLIEARYKALYGGCPNSNLKRLVKKIIDKTIIGGIRQAVAPFAYGQQMIKGLTHVAIFKKI